MQGMARKYRKFSPEFRDEAVRMVIDGSRSVAQVARELGMNETTLGNWVAQYRKDHAGDEPPLTANERIRLAEGRARTPRSTHGDRVPEKSGSVLREGSPIVEKYEFIDSCRSTDA